MSLKVVSLFSGLGGMDLGIQGGFSFLENYYDLLPYEVVYDIDNDSYYFISSRLTIIYRK